MPSTDAPKRRRTSVLQVTAVMFFVAEMGDKTQLAAMTMAGGEYAIHGTNVPSSIGGFVSYGCIRMHNRDISDLFERVAVGTTVVVSSR